MQLYFENRLKALALQKSAGINPYPHKFHVSMTILEYLEKYECLSNGDHLEDVQVSLAGINSINLNLCKVLLSISVMFPSNNLYYVSPLQGRIMNKRSSSSKLFFYDLHGGGAKVQVMADARYLFILIYLHQTCLLATVRFLGKQGHWAKRVLYCMMIICTTWTIFIGQCGS